VRRASKPTPSDYGTTPHASLLHGSHFEALDKPSRLRRPVSARDGADGRFDLVTADAEQIAGTAAPSQNQVASTGAPSCRATAVASTAR